MNSKSYNQNKIVEILLWIVGIVVAGEFILLYLQKHGNDIQIYTQMVVANLAKNGGNKAIEERLVFLLSIVGMILIFGIAFFAHKVRICIYKNQMTKLFTGNRVNSILSDLFEDDSYLVLGGLLIFPIFRYILWGDRDANYLMFFLFIMFWFWRCRSEAIHLCLFTFLVYYAVCAIEIFLSYCSMEIYISDRMVGYFLLLAIGLITLLAIKDKKKFYILMTIVQIPVPLLLFGMLVSRYSLNGEDYVIKNPIQTTLFVSIIAVLFVTEAIRNFLKNLRGDYNKLITMGSCVSILAFKNLMWNGATVPVDMHHPFENIIGFFQIFKLGQQPFKEYIPISGMYSIVNGALLEVFGNGQAVNYYLTQNVFILLIALLIVICLKKNVGEKIVFLIALFFYIPDYNRYFFVLPIMLLLSSPKCIEKRINWLILWFATSLLQGLYYPVYGVAVCIAFVPLGIYQIYGVCKDNLLKEVFRHPIFYIKSVLLVIATILSIPLLIGMGKHTLALSDVSVYADSIARFGQLVTSEFMPFEGILSMNMRQCMYYIVTFITLALPIWAAGYLIVKYFERGEIENILVCSSVITMLLVSYKFTILPFDSAALFSRSWGVLMASGVLILVMLHRGGVCATEKTISLIITIFIFATIPKASLPIYNNYSNFIHLVPDTYVYISDDDEISNWGEGFAVGELYNEIEEKYKDLQNIDTSKSYFGMYPRYGYYFMLGIKADAMIETYCTVGLKATQETFELLLENDTLIGTEIRPDKSYELYKRILTSGEYCYDSISGLFEKTTAEYDNVIEANKDSHLGFEDYDFEKAADSFGQSVNTLEGCMLTKVNIPVKVDQANDKLVISFPIIDGVEADVLLIEFDGIDKEKHSYLYNYYTDGVGDETEIAPSLMKDTYNRGLQVEISYWDDDNLEHKIYCDMERGKLLIPIGMGEGWLLDSHRQMTIKVLQDGVIFNPYSIDDIAFYNYSVFKREAN